MTAQTTTSVKKMSRWHITMTYRHDDISWWHIVIRTCTRFDMSSWYVIMICHHGRSETLNDMQWHMQWHIWWRVVMTPPPQWHIWWHMWQFDTMGTKRDDISPNAPKQYNYMSSWYVIKTYVIVICHQDMSSRYIIAICHYDMSLHMS